MTPEQFAKKIREKYPGAYDSIPDEELARKVIAKYPVYASQVVFPEAEEGEGEPSLIERGASRVGEIFKEEIGKAGEMTSGLFEKETTIPEKIASAGVLPLRALGATARAVGKTVAEPIVKGVEKTADVISDIPAVQKVAEGKVGGNILTGASDIAGRIEGALAEAKDRLSPEVYQSLKDAAEIALTVAGGKPAKEIAGAGLDVAKIAAKGAGEMGKDLGKAGVAKVAEGVKGASRAVKDVASVVPAGADRLIQFIETGSMSGVPKNIDSFIDSSIQKALRPSVAGKQGASDVAKYQERARTAVKAVASNKENLRLVDEGGDLVSKLPDSLSEFGESIQQTKSAIFKQYNNLAKQTGDVGAEIKLDPIATELRKMASNPVLQDNAPSVAQYATTRAETLNKRAIYTPEQAEEAIRLANQSLEAFYRNPSYDSATRVAVDALVANQMRKALDDTIESVTGKEYQSLKNTYGALKAIEKDVTRRTIVEGRKNVKGLIDYSDILSGGQAVQAILTLNPALLAQAATQKGIAAFYKRWVSPDATIKRMFDALERAD